MSYKFAGEDDDMFHVQHPDGSKFSIAKSAVGPGVHKKIKALEPVKMADGGEVPDETIDLNAPPPGDLFTPQASISPGQYDPYGGVLGNPMNLIPSPNDVRNAPIPPPTSDAIKFPEEAPSRVPAQAAQQPSEPQPIPGAGDLAPQEKAPKLGLDDSFAAQNAALESQKKINTQLGQVQAQKGASEAKNWENVVNQLADIDKKYQPVEDNLNQRNQELANAIQTDKIDPNRVWSNMSTGNKITAAISILLGGFGAGLQGKGAKNSALEIIDKDIERDIDSQKTELGKKQTLFSENLRQLGDVRAARAATKSQLMTIAQAQANKIAADSGSKEASLNMQSLNAGIDLKRAELAKEAKTRALLTGEGNANPDRLIQYLRMTNPAMAKEMEGRYVPSVGIGSVPVPEKVRDQLIAHKQLDDSAKDLSNWVKTHSTVVPGTEDYNVGAQKAQVLQQLIRHGQLQTVYREGEQPLLDKMVNSNPAGFLKSYSTEPKLKELIESNQRQFNTLKQGYGLPQQTAEQQLSPKQQQFAQWAKANPNNPNSALVLQKLGLR